MLRDPEGDEREQAEQGGGGAGDGLIGPLALGLDAEMATDLGEGDLGAPAASKPAQIHSIFCAGLLAEGDLGAPAASKPAQNIEWICGEIGAQEGLRAELILAVAHQHVADWDVVAGMRPDGGAADDLDLALCAAIPAWNLHSAPACVVARQLLRPGRAAATDDARPADPRPVLGRRFEQAGIQA